MDYYTVKELAKRLVKSEETIKRWIRSGNFPNASKTSNKEGWRIPEEDIINLVDDEKKNNTTIMEISHHKIPNINQKSEIRELISLAYQAVTMTIPSRDIVEILTSCGIKRTLEILLVMQQSPTKVKNPSGFIKKCIQENWSPNSTPVRLPRKKSKRIYELTQQDFESTAKNQEKTVPFYNWLEE